MVAHGDFHHKRQGGGIIETLMKPFTYAAYPGEQHAYSLAPSTFNVSFSYMGPGTRLDMRLNDDLTPKSDSQPINHADYASMQHDIAYMKAKDNYDKNPTKENKQRQLKKVWDADDQFIDEMKRDKEEQMAPIAGKLISVKKNL